MAALAASPPPWLPEDDLLLKNAVEAGASLEALAKGAVRFSRKFSVRELHERWHLLLYDADVSAEASARMVELEFSSYNSNSNSNSNSKSAVSKETAVVSLKRKIESVRRLYHSLRKQKCRTHGSFSPNLDFIDGLNGNECIAFGEFGVEVPPFEGESLGKDAGCIARDRLVEFGDCMKGGEGAPCGMVENNSSFCVEGTLSPIPRVPLWKTIEDVAAPEMPVEVSLDDKGRGEGEMLVDDMGKSGAMLDGEDNADVLDGSAPIPECNFADLSDALLNFPNEDEFMDVEGKDAMDKSCYDGVSLLLVNSLGDVHEDVSKEPQVLTSDANIEIPAGGCVQQLEVVDEVSVPVDLDEQRHVCSESNAPSSTSTSAPYTSSAECVDGQILCTLNTEDPDIPCNDNVTLANKFVSSVFTKTTRETCYLSSPCANQKDGQHERMLTNKEDNVVLSLPAYPKLGEAMVPGSSTSHKLVISGVNCQSPAAFSRQASNVDGDRSQCTSQQAIATSTSVGVLKTEGLHGRTLPLHVKSMSSTEVISGLEADASISNHEESGSDDDVPYFSDIEAMILEMDLCPDDSDSFINREVSKYQNEDTKRTIMRLEQCARSSMQRAMASRSALAVLYGRHLKHYIKETEVLLGRATEDTDVDIDLGREGPANQISRRQALIKMEGDGSFVLKNLGKSPIFLNGREISTGQATTLKSSSLIEIRRLAFVFETNSKSIKQYLAKVAKIHQDKKLKFEWSEEGVNHRENNIKFEWSEGVA